MKEQHTQHASVISSDAIAQFIVAPLRGQAFYIAYCAQRKTRQSTSWVSAVECDGVGWCARGKELLEGCRDALVSIYACFDISASSPWI